MADYPPSPEEASKQATQEVLSGLDRLSDFALEHGMDGLAENASKAKRRIADLTSSYLEACAENDRLRNELGTGCEANNGGEHMVMRTGNYAYCGYCGYSMKRVRYVLDDADERERRQAQK